MNFEDTKELEYSLDLSSTGEENLEDSESSSDGDSLPDANFLLVRVYFFGFKR